MKKLLLIAFVTLFAIQANAQTDGLPANPEPGKCYVKCITHDEFKTEEVRFEISPEYKVLSIIPATYKWVTEKVIVKEASKKLIYHPAEYRWIEIPYIAKETENVLIAVPATFGKDTKTITTFPKTGGWEYTTYAECTSPNPEDCQVLCYKEKPEQKITVPLVTLASDASTRNSTNPEKETSYKKQVIEKESWVETVIIPEVYATIKRQVVDQPAQTVEKIIPAKYKTVKKQVLVKKGGIATWAEIDCGLIEPTALNILWDLNSAKLRMEAKKEIDVVLLSLLQTEPDVSIELASHTDSRGSDEYNLALSQRRANSIKNYLVSKGISASRIVSKGYGESRLLNNCSNGVQCTEAEHRINRRTEYRVLTR